MKEMTLTKRALPQDPTIFVFVPNYKEPILPVNRGGFGWYGLQAYNEEGQLMCHECGEFWGHLSRHITKHGLNHKEYREKYGLQAKTKLVSETISKVLSRPLSPERRKHQVARLKAVKVRSHVKNYRLEFYNKNDTCLLQCMRWLSEAAKKYGDDISQSQANIYRPGLVTLIQRRFGSFNKLKQILRLAMNNHGKLLYNKQFFLEDMCRFHSEYGYWPKERDYIKGKMLCSFSRGIRKYGLKTLRQEAMKLKEEQDARAEVAERIPAHAVAIEMEYAGTARR